MVALSVSSKKFSEKIWPWFLFSLGLYLYLVTLKSGNPWLTTNTEQTALNLELWEIYFLVFHLKLVLYGRNFKTLRSSIGISWIDQRCMIMCRQNVFPVKNVCNYFTICFHICLRQLRVLNLKLLYFWTIAFKLLFIQNCRHRLIEKFINESRTSADGVCRRRPHKSETEGSCVSLVQPYIIQMFWRARCLTIACEITFPPWRGW